MNGEDIKKIVEATILELKKSGMLQDMAKVAHCEAGRILKRYYLDGEQDQRIRKVLQKYDRQDRYFKLIPLYYSYGYTVEQIAEEFDCEPSTIARNKKRLCCAIYYDLL